ncbi:Jerky protein [Plakobranchus ocellatus]|uniref:Jerky protein n=1 Tax=Plakobranchus ocellatus TaxID=259542 RepID=A0AAV4AM07_9GAST|nr:Jerky protein [Plakobranchus ocellatus]
MLGFSPPTVTTYPFVDPHSRSTKRKAHVVVKIYSTIKKLSDDSRISAIRVCHNVIASYCHSLQISNRLHPL